MAINTLLSDDLMEMYRCAHDDGTALLYSEIDVGGYEIPFPLSEIDPHDFSVKTIDYPAAVMRRGQSFAHSDNAVACTLTGSQSVFVRSKAHGDAILSTLPFGVAEPRGITGIPGSDLMAISGNSDNIAIFDALTGNIVSLYRVVLGGHSHLFWQPAV